MWNNVKKEAYVTVEATVVVTLMIFFFAFLMYMIVFSYDRILLTQNTHMMASYAKEEYRENKDLLQKNMDDRFSIIYRECPYLSFSDMKMKLSKTKNKIVISSEGMFITPFDEDILDLSEKSADIKCSSEVYLSDPVTIMLKTKDILGW